MSDTNEFDEYFAPVDTKAKKKILVEAPLDKNVPVPKEDTSAPEKNNEFEEYFNTHGNALPPKPFWTSEKAATAIGGVGGALYGAARTPTPSRVFTEWAAKKYGIPVEDVAAYMQMRNPAPPTAQEAARTVAAKSSAIPPQEAIVPEDPLSGHERWLAPRSAIPVPKALSDQMVTMTGGANVPGSGEEILARHAAGIKKVQDLGHDPFNMERQGSFYIPPSGRARPQSPQVWNRPRAVGPAPWTSPDFATPKVPAAPAAVPTTAPAPVSQVPVLSDLEQRIQRAGGLSNIAQRGANSGLAAFGGAMGGLQLLDALRSMREKGLQLNNGLQAAEGAGLVGAMKYPRVGIPVAGLAKMGRSAENMRNEGLTPENAAAMASGAGLTAMPRFPVAGALAQTPELYFALKKWREENPPETGYPIELH